MNSQGGCLDWRVPPPGPSWQHHVWKACNFRVLSWEHPSTQGYPLWRTELTSCFVNTCKCYRTWKGRILENQRLCCPHSQMVLLPQKNLLSFVTVWSFLRVVRWFYLFPIFWYKFKYFSPINLENSLKHGKTNLHLYTFKTIFSKYKGFQKGFWLRKK